MAIPQPNLTLITDADLVFPDGSTCIGSVLIEDGYISSISPDPPAALLLNRDNVEVISAKGQYLTPGLIELHFNGAFGCDVNRASIGSIQKMMGQLPGYGITAAVLTAITAPITDMLSAINTLAAVIHHQSPKHCQALGIHLEGPFISPQHPGVHPTRAIIPPSLDELNVLLSPKTRMVTLAPEADLHGEAIQQMIQRGIRVSMGHSDATITQAKTAIEQGITSATHLFNAMRPLHHREPGLIGAILTDDRVYAQIICDGAHVHPDVIHTVLRTKPVNRVLVTSDASPAAGMAEGSHVTFADQAMEVQKQQTINKDGVLAGSSKLVTDCIRNLVQWGLVDFPTAIRYATSNPADFLDEPELGRLMVGHRADLVLWDKKSLTIQKTFILGDVCFSEDTARV